MGTTSKLQERALNNDSSPHSASSDRFEPFYSFAPTDSGRFAAEENDLTLRISSKHAATEPPKYSPRLAHSPLNIVIQVIGSRGDVQPFIALGTALQTLHGHRVRLATHGEFKSTVLKSGIEFFDIGGDPEELMAYMVQNPSLIPNVQQIRDKLIQQKRAMYVAMLDGFWNSCVQVDQQTHKPFVADAIIANPPSFAHVHCAEALGIPVHLMFTMPWTSTKAFPHPLANMRFRGSDSATANSLSYSAVEILTWQGLGDIVNRWRTNTLELEPVPSTEGHRLVDVLEVPFTYCWSPALVPKPEDWGSHIDVCGFFFREPPSYTPPPDLEAFLCRGPPPVYIGFGSIVVGGIEGLMTTVLSAVRQTGVRAIISRGWSNLAGEDDENIYYIADCPHEWLFQQVSAVIHHGGAGTTACGLRYGRPTLVVPFFGDQPFWGEVISKAGAGPDPIPYRSLTSQRLVRGIEICLLPETRAAAQQLAASMQQEDGVMAAIDSFYRHLPGSRAVCDFYPGHTAALVIGNGSKKVKMCKAVAAVLVDAGKIVPDELRLYRSKPLTIENLRWDPITALSSSAFSTLKRLVQDTAGIMVRPAEVGLARPSSEAVNSESSDLRRQSTLPAGAMLPLADTSESLGGHQKLDSCPNTMPETEGKATPEGSSSGPISAYAKGGLRLAGTATKGVLVDLPLAATEGLRAVPKLYGNSVERHDTIKGFRSGVTTAGKNFVHDMRGGLTDIFVQTYTGKKAEGATGAAKGLGSGAANFIVKTGSAALGLVSYPALGVYRSIRSATNSVPHAVVRETLREGDWLVATNPRWNQDRAAILEDLEGLRSAR